MRATGENGAGISSVPKEKWDSLNTKKMFFGHQSVGLNILDGVDDIKKEHSNIRIQIVETKNVAEITNPMLAHFPIGNNENPRSKIDDFRKIIENGMGDSVDIALFKLCYIDINTNTNVNELFTYYVQTMDVLMEKYPKVQFFHCTIPLTTMDSGLKLIIKRALGKKSGVENNRQRCTYNALLRDKYGKSGAIFDIAAHEATYDDGTMFQIGSGTQKCAGLVPEYTDDGGHLNRTGRKRIAESFLLTLVSLL